MDSLSHFRSIEELVRVLDRERKLFGEMFEKRKNVAFQRDFAMELVDFSRERIQLLIDYGVVREAGDVLELDDVYVQFFEDVLNMNEAISTASVREYIDLLKDNIQYFLMETSEHGKYKYRREVRKILRNIGARTLRNVADLKHVVDDTYKLESNYRVKKSKLGHLDEKRQNIKSLINECEKLIDREELFFNLAGDPAMQETCTNLRNNFTLANHNLLETERQIIIYLNQIEQQGKLFRKIRRLKYLKDQLTWREDTNVQQVLAGIEPVWMGKRPYNRILLSEDALRNEDAYNLIRKVISVSDSARFRRTEAEPIDESFFADTIETELTVNVNELWNAFTAQGRDLFNFILNYTYKQPRTMRDHVILYCQMATSFSNRLKITEDFRTYENIEYALIYANEHTANI